MDTQRTRLYNARLTADYVCTRCHGALVERGELVVCAANCRPAGFVARSAAERATHERLSAADEARIVDKLRGLAADPAMQLTDEAKARIWRSLNGEERDA